MSYRRVFSVPVVSVLFLFIALVALSGCETDEFNFEVTKIDLGVDNANFTGTCPHNFAVSALFTTNDAGAITFFWETSEGTTLPQQTITIPSAGGIVVNQTFAATVSKSFSVTAKVVSPNQINSTPLTLTATCQ